MTRRVTYYKRYRMEAEIPREPHRAVLPQGFYWETWNDTLLERHADVQHQSFQNEPDSIIFPKFATLAGCRELMRAIRFREGFCSNATWLIAGPEGYVGTVQGRWESSRLGAIQNVGIAPGFRGLGLGEALLRKALIGFHAVGLSRVYLEVTAQNTAAVSLYRKHGFRCTRTIYKAVEIVESVPVGAGI